MYAYSRPTGAEASQLTFFFYHFYFDFEVFFLETLVIPRIAWSTAQAKCG